MPVAVQAVPKSNTVNLSGNPPQAKKKRVVRRRGRAGHGIDSDEEIEREVGTDSDSDNDDNDSFASSSSSEAETEPSRPRVSPTTASTAQTGRRDGSFFASSGSWSEMVADETTNGAADLPVINFSDLNDQSLTSKQPPRVRKAKKPAQRSKPTTSLPSPPLSVNEEHDEEATTEQSHEPSSSFIRRPPGQSARQAYQTKLEDPSYVPTVGEFWGHDDRLLDKDLRSLSGWWRGRWQGHGGRGRGMFGMRGRGGFMGRNMFSQQQDHGDAPAAQLPSPPPVEREWTHDGFEELKKTDEAGLRREQQTTRGSWGFRGRGRGFAPMRGRGAFNRGGFAPSPARTASTLPSGRIWYPMKPELSWTKQHEGFLYLDPSLRARRGRGAGFRVKLPGSRPQVIRSPLGPVKELSVSNPHATSGTSIVGSDYGGKGVVVKLPSAEATLHASTRVPPKASTPDKAKADELTIEDVFTVRPQLVQAKPIPLPEPSTCTHLSQVSPVVQQKLGQLSIPAQRDHARWSQTEEAVLRNPPEHGLTEEPQASSSTSETRPPLAPLQTTFTPPAQPSPYMSPYQYNVALPPGIAMNPMGMAFEVATGRAVYPAPPPQMFNPRMMPPPFVPGHMHHHSTASGEFVPAPTPPPMNFIDPSTGMPIFSFPQPSRIEIRAPDGAHEKSPAVPRTPSGLRSTATAFEPEKVGGDERQHDGDGVYPPADQQQQGMMYPPYGQYYYPDAYGGYMPYMDMSQMPPYEMYPPTQDHIPQGTVYYS